MAAVTVALLTCALATAAPIAPAHAAASAGVTTSYDAAVGSTSRLQSALGALLSKLGHGVNNSDRQAVHQALIVAARECDVARGVARDLAAAEPSLAASLAELANRAGAAVRATTNLVTSTENLSELPRYWLDKRLEGLATEPEALRSAADALNSLRREAIKLGPVGLRSLDPLTSDRTRKEKFEELQNLARELGDSEKFDQINDPLRESKAVTSKIGDWLYGFQRNRRPRLDKPPSVRIPGAGGKLERDALKLTEATAKELAKRSPGRFRQILDGFKSAGRSCGKFFVAACFVAPAAEAASAAAESAKTEDRLSLAVALGLDLSPAGTAVWIVFGYSPLEWARARIELAEKRDQIDEICQRISERGCNRLNLLADLMPPDALAVIEQYEDSARSAVLDDEVNRRFQNFRLRGGGPAEPLPDVPGSDRLPVDPGLGAPKLPVPDFDGDEAADKAARDQWLEQNGGGGGWPDGGGDGGGGSGSWPGIGGGSSGSGSGSGNGNSGGNEGQNGNGGPGNHNNSGAGKNGQWVCLSGVWIFIPAGQNGLTPDSNPKNYK